ncbi:hypothetical protein NH340_JMT08056 [Sarcoptes scabiei]|nr:hypothetical protein NH340_JMT08056 [Sarcoptes scabiei]
MLNNGNNNLSFIDTPHHSLDASIAVSIPMRRRYRRLTHLYGTSPSTSSSSSSQLLAKQQKSLSSSFPTKEQSRLKSKFFHQNFSKPSKLTALSFLHSPVFESLQSTPSSSSSSSSSLSSSISFHLNHKRKPKQLLLYSPVNTITGQQNRMKILLNPPPAGFNTGLIVANKKCNYEIYPSGCFDENGSICNNDEMCICRPGYTIEIANLYCLRPAFIGEACYTTEQCEHKVGNSGCFNYREEYREENPSAFFGPSQSSWPMGECRCRIGYRFDEHLIRCVRSVIGSWCSNVWDCEMAADDDVERGDNHQIQRNQNRSQPSSSFSSSSSALPSSLAVVAGSGNFHHHDRSGSSASSMRHKIANVVCESNTCNCSQFFFYNRTTEQCQHDDTYGRHCFYEKKDIENADQSSPKSSLAQALIRINDEDQKHSKHQRALFYHDHHHRDHYQQQQQQSKRSIHFDEIHPFLMDQDYLDREKEEECSSYEKKSLDHRSVHHRFQSMKKQSFDRSIRSSTFNSNDGPILSSENDALFGDRSKSSLEIEIKCNMPTVCSVNRTCICADGYEYQPSMIPKCQRVLGDHYTHYFHSGSTIIRPKGLDYPHDRSSYFHDEGPSNVANFFEYVLYFLVPGLVVIFICKPCFRRIGEWRNHVHQYRSDSDFYLATTANGRPVIAEMSVIGPHCTANEKNIGGGLGHHQTMLGGRTSVNGVGSGTAMGNPNLNLRSSTIDDVYASDFASFAAFAPHLVCHNAYLFNSTDPCYAAPLSFGCHSPIHQMNQTLTNPMNNGAADQESMLLVREKLQTIEESQSEDGGSNKFLMTNVSNPASCTLPNDSTVATNICKNFHCDSNAKCLECDQKHHQQSIANNCNAIIKDDLHQQRAILKDSETIEQQNNDLNEMNANNNSHHRQHHQQPDEGSDKNSNEETQFGAEEKSLS